MKMKNKLLLVFYINIKDIDPRDIENFMHKIGKRIQPKTINAESILIPIFGESRVECINPQYITDSDLIKKHERLMAELNEHLENQLKSLNLKPAPNE